MIAETNHESQEHQVCTGCWQLLPADRFRFINRAEGRRHARCRDCRREADRLKRERARDQRFQGGLRDLRRSQTPEQILNVLESVAADLGGMPAVAEEWARHLRGDGVSVSRKLKAMETMVYAASVADLARIQETLSGADGPSDVAGLLRHFAEVDQPALIAALRRMLDEGELTLDDLDPPPAG